MRRAWPRITRFDDRWRWIVTSIVPRFRRIEKDMYLVEGGLHRIFDQARDYASNPCVRPRLPQTEDPLLGRTERDDGATSAESAPSL